MSVMTMIDLKELTDKGKVKNLLGKERGVAGRAYFHLDDLDAAEDQVMVSIPKEMESIAPSFFQGMFSKSVLKSGGKAEFLNKYRFEAENHIMDWINIGIRDSLMQRKSFLD